MSRARLVVCGVAVILAYLTGVFRNDIPCGFEWFLMLVAGTMVGVGGTL